MGFNHGMHVPVVSVLGTSSNYDDDDDDNAQKNNNWVYEQNNSSARASRFLVHLFTARPRQETSQCEVLCRTWTYDDKFSFLYLNMDKPLRIEPQENSATFDELSGS